MLAQFGRGEEWQRNYSAAEIIAALKQARAGLAYEQAVGARIWSVQA